MTLITPSKWLCDLVKDSFLKEYSVEIVHNKIDLDVFCPTVASFREERGWEDKKIILGVASAWNERKGLSDFISLSTMLDDTYQIVLVGLSQKQLNELPKTIFGMERTDSKKELAALYSTADVFVNLTYEDTYPTVNLEAQACGTPCLTYATGGSVESVPSENVVTQGDLVAMVERIKEICLK